eukprot:CAMPEP_0170600700 /NCGR_PEP_ID=MMETSP0224-20130122/17471_1 /TAXON_ID=285029 /ORGANISM="Togula jolla, Strain CCCM 725" /LENGTH=46 /DNA_ID= /DNA_START= /DNA_END= /DNA_ORIENTATION=
MAPLVQALPGPMRDLAAPVQEAPLQCPCKGFAFDTNVCEINAPPST